MTQYIKNEKSKRKKNEYIKLIKEKKKDAALLEARMCK
jgi:hypothetical protein